MDNSRFRSQATAVGGGFLEKQHLVSKGNAVSILEILLREVLCNIQPSDEDHSKRMSIISKITTVLQDLKELKGASVKPFGSFVSNLYTRWGDLDISIEMLVTGQESSEIGKRKKNKILRSIRQALLRRGVTRSVQIIPSARVPLLMFEDSVSQISCDVSINNGSGLLKSKLLFWISKIDTRCRDLIFLIKYWAKVHNINDPKTGTLNSFSVSLLVIFHLQTRSPPILPPIKQIYDGDVASDLAGQKHTNETQIEAIYKYHVERFQHHGFGRENTSGISDLFVSFFSQYADVAANWVKGLTVCTFTGNWAHSSSIDCKIKKQYAMTIQDPFDHTENCARSVTESTLGIISDEFMNTAQSLKKLPGISEMHSLRQRLFGSPNERPRPYIHSQEKIGGTSRKHEDDPNKGRSIKVPEVPYAPPIQCRPQHSANTSLHFLPTAFSQGCSLQQSIPCQPRAVSVSPAVYMHQAQPSFQNNISLQLQQEHTMGRKQQPITSTTGLRTSKQNGSVWKPKSDSMY